MTTRGPRVITFHGRPLERRLGFVDLPNLTCPDGHRLRLSSVLVRDEVGVVCTNKESQGRHSCDALVWLLNLPAAGDGKRYYAADIEFKEGLLWERSRYTVDDVLQYLGAWFPRDGGSALHRQRA